ncbi:MAG: aminotransferase class V-fold PLP-dependent enzyme [Deltaproteobacteria bacterium]|nr:aminotransferase class V-fold PLP-dependent enzyme [Myxococcales bacterium]MDP3216261.1 aminotransferase class V-fold PLP-dependent enzyme [Deltaproteobacteria bacterium]
MHLDHHFALDPSVTFLNHGSFGAAPRAVLAAQQRLRDRMEAQPVQFLVRDLEGLLDEARAAVGAFVDAPADDLVFVPNATHAVNAVLRSLTLSPGDELVVTDHGYAACTNAARFAAERAGARVVTAEVPFPLRSPGAVLDAITRVLSPRTRLVLVDHVTSPTALVFPVEDVVHVCQRAGVDVLVDGAHAPGMIPLSLRALGAAFYTGNLHKWVCAPKGAAFLHVHPSQQHRVRPLVISHGASSRRTDRARLAVEFDWMGTLDPTAVLCAPAAIDFMGSLLPGAWDALRAANRALALEARDLLCDALGVSPPAPDAMIGSMATVPLPADRFPPARGCDPAFEDRLQQRLWEQHRIEVPVMPWGSPPRALLRVSAQAYNHAGQYRALARALAG